MKAKNQIPVLAKAIRVLQALANGQSAATAGALAKALKISPATGYRIVQTFAQAGWIHIDDDGGCELGMGLLPLLQHLQDHDLLSAPMSAALQHLTDTTGLASKISAREADDAITVLRVNSDQPMAVAVRPGSRFHLTLGSSGAILMGDLADEEIRRIIEDAPAECWKFQKPADVWRRIREARGGGIVADQGQYRPDILGISVPLRDAHGHVRGAMTVTGLLHGHSQAQIQRWRDLLLRTAAQLNQRGRHDKLKTGTRE